MQKKLTNLIKILLFLFIVINLTSCGYKDIDKRIFALAVGVAKGDKEKYKVVIKFAIPTADIKAGQKNFLIIKEKGDSITEAIRMIKSKVDKEIDFSHTEMIVFEDSVLQEDVKETIDWFIRRRDVQKIAWVGVGEAPVEDILNLKPKSESLPANALFLSFGQIGTESPYIVTEYLFDLRKRLTEKGLDPILPIIKVNSFDTYTINTSAVLSKKSIKLRLNEEETKIINALMNRAKSLDVKVGKDGGEESFYIAVDVAKANYKIIEGKNPRISVDVQLEGILEESISEMSREKIQENEKVAEKQIKNRVEHVLTLLQKENLDPIGFGLLYRGTHFRKNDWDRWGELYPSVEFDINIDLTLQGSGLLK